MRDLKFDLLKYILALLVVIGHILEMDINKSGIFTTLQQLIYSFHMPLFVFISGYFSKRVEVSNIKQHIIPLVELFLCYHVFFKIPKVINGNFVSLITPYWIFWYIYSLIIWRIVAGFINTLNFKYKFFILFLSIIGALFAGYCDKIDYVFGLSRTIVFFPFFLLGMLTDKKQINFLENRKVFMAGSAILLVFLFLNMNIDKIALFRSALPYDGSFNIIDRLLFFLWAFVLSATIIAVTPSNLNVAQLLGRQSFTLYIVHGLIIIGVNKLLLKLDVSLNLAILISILLLSIMTTYTLHATNLDCYVTKPLTSLRISFNKIGSQIYRLFKKTY